jgi:hypothetical protein
MDKLGNKTTIKKYKTKIKGTCVVRSKTKFLRKAVRPSRYALEFQVTHLIHPK